MDAEHKRERLSRFEEACRQRGLSLTVQRRTILDAMLDRTDHPTADDVYADVQARIPGVSRTTVYRVLETLVEVGVLHKAAAPGAIARYDPMTDRHHHLVCRQCSRLIDLPDDRLHQRVKLPDVSDHEFEIHDFSIQFHGICAACRGNSGSTSGAPQSRKARTPVTKKIKRSRTTQRRKRK